MNAMNVRSMPAAPIKTFCLAAALAGLARLAAAEPVYNGNDLGLALATAKADQKTALTKQHVGALHIFRYLKILLIARDKPETGAVTLSTVEPSSDMRVVLVVRNKLSLTLADTLQTNDCVAVKGRLVKLGLTEAQPSVVDPALLQRKDRAAPKTNNELLNETDTTAH
jgi:hypothetical protein